MNWLSRLPQSRRARDFVPAETRSEFDRPGLDYTWRHVLVMFVGLALIFGAFALLLIAQ